jgi:C4-dicarboxylate transporter/malic acid transport protein
MAFEVQPGVMNTLLRTIRQFTPNWFGATMGTGILAVALAALPGAASWVRTAGEALWLLDIALFALFAALYGARWAIFPREAAAIFRHPVMSMFLGCIPMGLATIVNGLVIYGRARFGEGAVELAQAFWIVDAVMALACGVTVPFAMVTGQDHRLERMTAVWLLPLVACEVAAASAAVVAPTIGDPSLKLTLIAAGYVLWGCSVPASLSILAILMLRLVLHKLPPAEMAASAWLPLGPIGTGALGLAALGSAAGDALHGTPLQMLGDIARYGGLIGALPLWGYGAWWIGLALLTTARHARLGMAFNLGWWAYVFPLGVYTVATLKLSAGLGLPVFAVIGQALTACLVLVWATVAGLTVLSLARPARAPQPVLGEYSI